MYSIWKKLTDGRLSSAISAVELMVPALEHYEKRQDMMPSWLHYCPFVREIQQLQVDSFTEGKWCGPSVFSWLLTWKLNLLAKQSNCWCLRHFDTQVTSIITSCMKPWMQLVIHTMISDKPCQQKESYGSGPRFNIKMSSYQYRKSHCGDKTVVRSSYHHNGISYTDKMTSLYWIKALILQLYADHLISDHSSQEDAVGAMELVLYKMRQDQRRGLQFWLF